MCSVPAFILDESIYPESTSDGRNILQVALFGQILSRNVDDKVVIALRAQVCAKHAVNAQLKKLYCLKTMVGT